MNKKKWIFILICALCFVIAGFIINKKIPGTGLQYLGLIFGGILILHGGFYSFRDWLNK